MSTILQCRNSLFRAPDQGHFEFLQPPQVRQWQLELGIHRFPDRVGREIIRETKSVEIARPRLRASPFQRLPSPTQEGAMP